MTEKNLMQTSSENITISRQTRNAFIIAIGFNVAALINFVVSLQLSLRAKTVIASADTIVVFLFVITTIFSAVFIRKGQKNKGVWLLLFSFVLMLALRNAFTTGLGIIFSILSITLIPFIGLLTLKTKSFNRTLSLGLLSSSFYLIFDILATRYLPPYRQLSENVEIMVKTITIISIIITFAFIIALYKQHRFLLLSSKITLVIVFFVLVPIILVRIAGAASLGNSLSLRQNEEMRIKATFLADSINVFIETNKNIIKADSQASIFAEYLASFGATRKIEHSQLEKDALNNLRSIRRKDISQINSYAILDIFGKNLLDTSLENVGNDESEKNYFIQAKETGTAFVSDISRDSSNNLFLYFSAPIYHAKTGEMIGVLRMEYKASALEQYINNYIQIEGVDNQTIFAALLTEKDVKAIDAEDPTSVYLLVANSKSSDLNLKSVTHLTTNIITPLQIAGILPLGSTAQLSLDVPNFDEGLRNRHTNPVFEAQAFPRETRSLVPLDMIATADIKESSLSWTVIISQDIKSLNALLRQQRNINILLTILIAVVATILAYYGSQYLIAPLRRLTNTANQLAQGNLNARASIDTEDEIGVLGKTFNSMAEQVSTLVNTLETRIAERTQALERNAQHLHAAVEVGKTAASLHNLDELLSQAAKLISAEFGYYHIGIFLLDPYGKYALLKAANSKGGRRMLARAHKLEVGAEGIVGYVTASGEARIALDVGRDATFFDNPLLPDTRSEMALPLIAGGKVLGALDIQSTEGEAFNEADIPALQVLADQIAIAIENAHLFDESQKALAIAQRAYGEQSQLGWQELLHQTTTYGYRSNSDGNIFSIDKQGDKKLEQAMRENQTLLDADDSTANIPIMVRGESVGAIQLSKHDRARKWSQQELNLAKILTAEISRAMDSARLFDETKKQADRERVVGEISDRMRETMSVEAVIRTTANELYELLDLEQITIHLSTEDVEEEQEASA